MSKDNKKMGQYYDFHVHKKCWYWDTSVKRTEEIQSYGTVPETTFFVSENILKGEKKHEKMWELLTMES